MGQPDNWTIASAVHDPARRRAWLAHGVLPATRGRFAEVSLAEAMRAPGGVLSVAYAGR